MAKSLVDYVFRYMATKFMSQDDKDAVGIINQQLTLSEAEVVSGDGAPDTTTSPAGATASAAAPAAPASSNISGPARGAVGDEATAIPVEAKEAPSLMDRLKIVAQNGAAADARSERLNVGQAPVIFDTADSPACTECGSIMVRNGWCYKCINCGATSGCS